MHATHPHTVTSGRPTGWLLALVALWAIAGCEAPVGAGADTAGGEPDGNPTFGTNSASDTNQMSDTGQDVMTSPGVADASSVPETPEVVEEPGDGPDAVDVPEACTELTAVIGASVSKGPLPLTVAFDSEQSCTPHEITESWWSFGVDGQTAAGRDAGFTYLGSGTYTVTLTLTDAQGQAHATTAQITVEAGLCPSAIAPVTTGFLEPDALDEPSGLATSPTHADLLWTHNDSGGAPRLFAVDGAGQPLAAFDLDEAENVDWEDIAAGLDPATGLVTLYIWDGGDNNGSRLSTRVLMVPEPSAETLALDPAPALGWTSLELTYP
ncbi:MAG: PKD domain-containing protein, partial [Myxococcota bacterium]|nr:PKD domain-containing protein [Myxococcota bacterium]